MGVGPKKKQKNNERTKTVAQKKTFWVIVDGVILEGG